MRSLHSMAPLSHHFHHFCNRKPQINQKHDQITTKFNHKIEARSDSIQHSPLHCPVNNGTEIIGSWRIAGVARNREESESKKNENDEGEHEKHGKNNRGRRRFPRWKTRVPGFRHCQKRDEGLKTLELDLKTQFLMVKKRRREEDQKRWEIEISRTRFYCFPSQTLSLSPSLLVASLFDRNNFKCFFVFLTDATTIFNLFTHICIFILLLACISKTILDSIHLSAGTDVFSR